MADQKNDDPDRQSLEAEVRALRDEVHRLNEQSFLRHHGSFWHAALWNLWRGLAYGLGTVLGATIVLSLLLRMLGSMDFVPVIGDWAERLIEEIQTDAPPK